MGKVVKTFKNQTRQAHRESSPAGIYFFFFQGRKAKKNISKPRRQKIYLFKSLIFVPNKNSKVPQHQPQNLSAPSGV